MNSDRANAYGLKLYSYLCLAILPIIATAADYQKPAEFIRQAFSDEPPAIKKIWLNKTLKQEIRNIMGHDLGVLRKRYWGKDQRTAWVLETIGKEQLITVGIIINQHKIEKIKVLAFRESRGWEIRYPFFTDQFTGITLKKDQQLSHHIDGISGATLSVKAMQKMARLALLLDQKSK